MKTVNAAGADRIIVTLREWKSEAYTNVALEHDVNMTVCDREGQTLAEKEIKGRDDLGGSSWNPPAHTRRAVPEALKSAVEELLNSREIAKAFRQAARGIMMDVRIDHNVARPPAIDPDGPFPAPS